MTKERFDLLSTPRVARHGKFEEQYHHQAVQCLREAKEPVRIYSGKISETRLLSRITHGNWKKSADTWTNSHWKTSPTRLPEEIRKQLEVDHQRPGTGLTDGQSDDYLKAVKAIKNLRQQAGPPSNPPDLLSYQTRQRPLQERPRTERQWNWQTWSESRSSCSSAWTGSQPWWTSLKMGGLQLISNVLQGVSLSGNGDSLVTGGVKQYTLLARIHTRKFFSCV